MTPEHGVFLAFKKPRPHRVRFACRAGSLGTLEGPVSYQRGDALLTDEDGNTWPIARARFEQHYAPLSTTKHGENGMYAKRRIVVQVRKVPESFTIDLAGGRGSLRGQAGDYLVTEPDGARFIVAAHLFPQYYQVL